MNCPLRGSSLVAGILLLVAGAPSGYYQTAAAQPQRAPVIPLDVRDERLSLRGTDLAVTFEKVWEVIGALGLFRRADGMLWLLAPSGLYRFDGYDVGFFHEPLNKPEARIANWFMCAAEDEYNTLWLGSQYGFRRFDDVTGSFETFLHDTASSATISHNFITTVCADRKGHVWVGTPHGLNRFDIVSRLSTRFYHDSTRRNSLVCDTITHVVAGGDGVIWVGTRQGLSRYDPSSGIFANYTETSPPPFRLPANGVRQLCICKDGVLYIATDAGLSMFDFGRGVSRQFPPQPSDSAALPEAWITSMAEDGLGNLWLGTNSSGLVRLDRSRHRFSRYPNDKPSVPNVLRWRTGLRVSQSMRSVQSVAFDHMRSVSHRGEPGVLWVSADRVLWRVTVVSPWFSRVLLNSAGPAAKSPLGLVNGSTRDHLWLRRGEDALGLLDLRTLSLRTFTPRQAGGQKVAIGFVTVTRDSTAYLSTSIGLCRLDLDRRELVPIPGTRTHSTLTAGRDGSIWFATPNPRMKYPVPVRYDPTTGEVTYYPRDELPGEPPVGGYITAFLEDKAGDIWYGTFGKGLFRLNPQSGKYRLYASSTDTATGLKTNVVRQVHEDSSGGLWVGTDSGLHRYITGSDRFESFTTTGEYLDDGGHFIRALTFDQHQNVWLGHSHGISRFDRTRRHFRDFADVDGLDLVQFSSLKFHTESGIMYAGDLQGNMIAFRPDELPTGAAPLKVILTDFRVFENPVPLPGPVYRMREVELRPDQNFFSFRYSALEFVRISKIFYAYKMDGFDRDWVQAKSRTYAAYTNLDPGRYTFQVKATDANGVWSDSVTALSVVIHPPWWQTVWAYILFTLAGAVVLYGFWRYDRKRVGLRHQLAMKDFETRKLVEVDQVKTRFFANISHEFRTPLTLILGPVEKLRSRLSAPDIQKELGAIHRNAHRLLQLVNQLLDLSKLDAGRMALQVCPTDLVSQLKALVHSFLSLAERRRITLLFDPHDDALIVYVDRDKVEKIITNLLSNAVKFTDDGGEIVVSIARRADGSRVAGTAAGTSAETGWVEITVTDTGRGIAQDKLEKIFDRFYQVDGTLTREQSGSGIGLSLTSELVELHRGYIRVSSAEGKGSTFIVGLPLGRQKFTVDEVVEHPPEAAASVPVEERIAMDAGVVGEGEGDGCEEGGETGESGEGGGAPTGPMVLVVEDNVEVRRYIREYLEKDHRVLEAGDGVEGLETAFASLPDLVITDIMMPRMDGVELCKRLKNDEKTSHIPVILLTARASSEDKVGGLETGADDYIIKPFEAKELQVRVHNLIEIRRKLREKFKQNIILQPTELAVTSSDERFLGRLMESVEKHMADPDCDTETLAQDVYMSRMQLNRKLQALTGHSTHEFLRAQRLKRAAQILQQRAGNVSEVAYEVGFASPSHFARAFREQFGVPPSEYISRNIPGPYAPPGPM